MRLGRQEACPPQRRQELGDRGADQAHGEQPAAEAWEGPAGCGLGCPSALVLTCTYSFRF